MTIKNDAISSGKWSAISTILIVSMQMLQVSIVSRYLEPTAFGLMGVVLIVIGFANSFSDMGLSNAIIQKKHSTKEQLSSLYWLNIAAGLLVFIGIFLGRHIIADLFNSNEDLVEILGWISIIFIILPFGQQFQILLQKNLQFKKLAYITTIATLIATSATITFAYYGFGVYALVWGQIINAIVSTLILMIYGYQNWKPAVHFRLGDLEGYLSFGLYQIGDRTVTYFNNNLDSIIIGRYLGLEALGYYTIACNLIVLPLTKINPIITRVAFPVFSKIQDDNERLKKGYMKVIHTLSLINFPLYFGLLIVAPLFVPFMFGKQWMGSIVITQILCGVGLLRTIANPGGSLVMARGRVDLGFMYNLAKTVLQIPAIFLGAYFGGLVGAASAFLFLKVIYYFTNYRIVIRSILGPCFKSYIFALRSPFIMSLVMMVFVWMTGSVFGGFDAVLVLTIQIAIGVSIYVVQICITKPELFKRVRTQLKLKSNSERVKSI